MFVDREMMEDFAILTTDYFHVLQMSLVEQKLSLVISNLNKKERRLKMKRGRRDETPGNIIIRRLLR